MQNYRTQTQHRTWATALDMGGGYFCHGEAGRTLEVSMASWGAERLSSSEGPESARQA